MPPPPQPAPNALAGEWLIDFSRKNQDEVQFTVFHRTKNGKKHESGDGVRLSQFQGLTREAAFSAGTHVNFRLVREAGTFNLEGTFRAGKGAGHWTLTPDQNFIAAARRRGYDNLTGADLFNAARHDITLKSIDDLKAAGYDRLTFDELLEANIFKVTSEFIREMRAAGYENLTFEELVEARIFKVDSRFVKEVSAMGFGRQPFKRLVEMRVHKVTPEFVDSVKAEGFTSISLQEAVDLRVFRVDAEFIRRVKARGYANPTLEQLVDMRIHGREK